MNETLTVHRRTATYDDHEPVVEHAATYEVEALSVQPADEGDVESAPEGQRVPERTLLIWVAVDDPDWPGGPRTADHHEPASVADVVEWDGAHYELKSRQTFHSVLPHHRVRALRVDDLEGLPSDG